MWYGHTTHELEKLYDKYYNMFKSDPDEYIELEYGEDDYDDYVRDIKKSLELKKNYLNYIIKYHWEIVASGIFILIFTKD